MRPFRIIPFFVTCFLLSAFCPLFSKESPTDTEGAQAFRLAGELYLTNPAAAKDKYQEFLKNFPKSSHAPEAQIMMAECLFAGNPASLEALKAYQSAAARGESLIGLSEAASYRVGEVLYNLRRSTEALTAFRKHLQDFPQGALKGEALLAASFCELSMGRYDKALAILETLPPNYTAYQKDPRLLYAKGVAAYEVGYDSTAISVLSVAPASEESLYYLARAYMRYGQPLLAVERLKKIIQDYGDSPRAEDAHFLLGRTFLEAQDYLSAITAYEKFLRLYSKSGLRSAALFGIGVSHFNIPDHVQARSSFQGLLQEDPQSEFAAPALHMIGESFRLQGRLKDAAFAYSDLATNYPQHPLAPRALVKLAFCQLEQKSPEPAQASLSNFFARYPDHPLTPLAYLLLGNGLNQRGSYAEAARAYQRTLDLVPSTDVGETALTLMSRANYLGNDDAALVSSYQHILNKLPPSKSAWRPAAFLYIAEGYIRQGLFSEALSIYENLLTLYPASPLIPYVLDGMAFALSGQGKDAQSLKERERLSEMAKRWPIPQELLITNEYETANGLFNLKRYLEAIALYEKFATANPAHARAPEAIFRLGLAYYRWEYYGQAISTWEKLERDFPASPQAKKSAWQIADTYFRAQKYEQAVATYKRILEMYAVEDEEKARAALRIAQSHYNAKNPPLAITAFEEVVTGYPKAKEAEEALEFLGSLLESPSAEAALKSLERISQASNSPLAIEARYKIAANLYEKKNYQEASKTLETLVVELMTGSRLADSQFYLAESYHQLGEHAKAAVAYQRFLSNFGEDIRVPLASFRLASALFKAGQHAEAGVAFLKMARENPKSDYVPSALYNAGLAYKKAQRWEEAIASLTSYLKEYPEKAKADGVYEELAGLYEAQRNFPQAVESLVKAREGLGGHSEKWLEITLRMADDFLAMGGEEKALETLQTISDTNPKSHPLRLSALAKFGELLEKREMLPQAIAVYEDLARNTTNTQWAQAARARIAALRVRTGAGLPSDSQAAPEKPSPGFQKPAPQKSAPKKRAPKK